MQAGTLAAPVFTRLAHAVGGFSLKYRRLVVIAMLLLLHFAVMRGVADGWARALLLAHLGVLLLWQPFLRGQHQVTFPQAIFIALLAVGVMLWLDWWLLAFWVVVLAGLVGGKVFQQQARWQRGYYLLVVLYLLALLAVVILPEIAPLREIQPEIRMLAEYGLPLLFVVMALLPVEPEPPEAPQVIDFFYSIFLMLVLGVVILGSFTFMTLGRTSYLEALTYTVFLIAATVFVIGLAWNPRTGYAGLNVFFSRYLFSIGLPVEKWLYFLAELSQLETRPDRFLSDAVAGLARLTWVSGASWKTALDSGEAGEKTAYVVDFENSALSLRIHSRYRTSPALHWHLRVLGQLLGEFYTAKLREQKLQQQGYMQAVHETGARVTHDVKNLLQSLNALCSIAGEEANRDSPGMQALIRKQLPVIAQRLSATLAKLQRPQAESDEAVRAQVWWDALVRQYQGQGIEFSASGLGSEHELPRTLFDSVADNLLQNALGKRAEHPAVRVAATLACNAAIEFQVSDTGPAVPAEIEKHLLRGPVRSSTGLGIGLYQAARHAESSGFLLTLARNRDGEVCFTLSGALASK